ncbi:MAG: rhodanese-like domain-containing protein [Coxiellaceae bacterium]|jgi:rhodanese-related sulfurtransferase|nr:rhodanese-like domain-containing protein [Coxiellaceae bacterium]
MIQQIFQFIYRHWILCSAGIVVLLMLIIEELKEKSNGATRVSIQEAALLLNRKNAVVIDLRTQQSFSNGYILGAINIPINELEHNIKKLESYKNDSLILVDNNELNPSAINIKLRKHGFTKINVLAGGLNAWKDARMPLTQDIAFKKQS